MGLGVVAWSSDIWNGEEWPAVLVLIVELVNTSFSVELEGLGSVVVGLLGISSVVEMISVVELVCSGFLKHSSICSVE